MRNNDYKTKYMGLLDIIHITSKERKNHLTLVAAAAPDYSDLSYVSLSFRNVAKRFVSTIHVIVGPVDPSCFTKVG